MNTTTEIHKFQMDLPNRFAIGSWKVVTCLHIQRARELNMWGWLIINSRHRSFSSKKVCWICWATWWHGHSATEAGVGEFCCNFITRSSLTITLGTLQPQYPCPTTKGTIAISSNSIPNLFCTGIATAVFHSGRCTWQSSRIIWWWDSRWGCWYWCSNTWCGIAETKTWKLGCHMSTRFTLTSTLSIL